jgi:hypothetical protein
MFLTGSFAAVRQPRRFQPSIHRVMPSRRYWLSLTRRTVQGRFSAASAAIAAVNSIRLLVVAGS